MPNTHKVKDIDIGSYGTIQLPLVSDEEYHLLLSNSSFKNETAYSLGINKAPQSFETFDETSAQEPNNQESTASTVSLNESIVSYLHATDLDYWKISLPENEYLFDFSLGKFQDTRDVNLSQIVTSNKIYIPENIILDNNISIEIDKGDLVINDIDINSTKAIVSSTDSIAIKLKAPSQDSSFLSSTLLFGQNSISFTLYTVDTTAPIFISSANLSIDENMFIVGKVKAEDTNTILYSIIDQNISDFNINKTSGELRFKKKPDYEKQNIYKVTVKATDSSNNSTLQNIKIDVKDIKVEFIRSSNGIVTDNGTELMWQDNISKKIVRSTAIDYCHHLSLGNYIDWYLPSLSELKSIIDYDISISPIFKTIHFSKYWSGSSSSSYYYYIDFMNARVYKTRDNYSFYIRCVRKINE